MLFPPIEPYQVGRLKVSSLHEIYYEECGNPQGKPAVYLHGGPGAGLTPTHRRFHDPEKYRLILLDQRGAGKSTPFACLEENTTWDLVSDLEKLRQYLSIEKWQVFGGSWGSTLALIYAQTYPERVSEIILRGIFLATRPELEWFYGGKGTSFLFPELWEKFRDFIPKKEQNDMIAAYYQRLTSSDVRIRQAAAKLWTLWEYALLTLLPQEEYLQAAHDIEQAEKIARIECHYFVHHAFLKTPHWIIENMQKIQNHPGAIIHGRYDVICPAFFAWELHKVWPKAYFHIIPDAGHSGTEPGIEESLVKYTQHFSLI